MASDDNYDKLADTVRTGDKEMLMEDMSSKPAAATPRSGGDGGSTEHHEVAEALKKSKKVLEAGKAVLQDQSRGFRIIVTAAILFSFIITVALILSIYLGPPQIGANAAVATDVQECSDMGLQMLEKGGNAVDAAVSAMFCLGVVNAESSGLGGGGFMLVHDHKVEKSQVFDFRETAPALLKASMYNGDRDNLEKGSLSVGVPGELKGMEAAHKQYGKLKWKTVVSPAADLARKGFRMTGHTDYVLNHPKFDLERFMASRLAPYYTSGGELKKESEVVTRPDLAAALDLIAEDGSSALYSGRLGDEIVEELTNAAKPGVLTKDDLTNYQVEMRDVVKTTFKAYTVESVPAPGSGPVLLSIINQLESQKLKKDAASYHHILEATKFGFAKKELLGDPKFNTAAIKNATDVMIRLNHHMVEATKFGFAKKELLGDPKFNTAAIKNATDVMISKEEAVRLRNLTANETKPADYYGKIVGLPTDKGTSHVSVIDTAELIVSVTTTVNDWFGSMITTQSGILLNNQLGDFNLPDEGPNNMNEVYPGKRPLSSMTPTVVYETGHLCGLRMVCGGANGSRIITGVAEVLLNNLTFGQPLGPSIEAPRVHSQLYNPGPEVVEAEEGFSDSILDDLKKMGHVIQPVEKMQSIVNAVLKIKDNIIAVSDSRKQGSGPAMFH